jgi:DNA repair exonuclease SbcCD nuclease subunit
MFRDKTIEIGDFHMGKFSTMTQHNQFWYSFLKPMCCTNTTLIFTGDLFDEDRNISSEFISEVVDLFVDISSTVKDFYFIVGNHDTYKYENIDINVCKMLSTFHNGKIRYYAIEEISGCKVGWLSYNHSLDFLRNTLIEFKKQGVKLVYSHADILELTFDNGAPVTHGLSKEDFLGMNVVNGHIHKRQILENVENIGSPMQMKFSDSKNIVGVNIIENGIKKFVENKLSPRYLKISYKKLLVEQDNKDLFINKHIWVTDIEDIDSIKHIFGDIDVLSIRTDFVNKDTLETYDSNFDYHHDSNPLDQVEEFLEQNKVIAYNSTLVEVDEERIKRVSQKVKNL